ncbi:fatty acid-binding protein DegV [Lottiidibacillus patelloidae]|uniref:Fatty acid-binding protein DegV n=1 Tax=Lottiidibacillus patelloidae TaxID=2670334 RepID=A0A263BS44_9BACI|nr:DegV family protein [Lottiidibacillus patelloidae]OZM56515.1 fatty acid-binding protein DegV [Lottiidibacillus patelloidae]
MTIAIVTDSTAYLPKEVREEHNIYMVPLNVIFGSESYQEELELTTDQFYEEIKKRDQLPKTSQPAIGNLLEMYEKLAEDYDEVISIHLSSGISGTFQSAVSAGNMVDGIKVHAFDTEISAMAQGFYVLEAAKMAKQGKTVSEIITRLEEIKESMKVYFMADDLSHLHRGGRLNAAQLLVGSMLKIKPLLSFVDKKIVPFEKIRTRKKAIKRILELFDEDINGSQVKATVIHSQREEEACALKAEIEAKYPNAEVVVSHFGPVIGTHLGEGSIGMAWYKK